MGGQVMHTKKEEILVYTIGAIGFFAILFLNLKSGFSLDSFLAILKDLAPLMISLVIFYMLNGFLFRSSDFEKAANKALKKIKQHYKEILAEDNQKFNTETAQEYLFFKKRKTAFIPIQPLREGVLEIRVSFGTLDNFETISAKDATENEVRIANKKELVKNEVIARLQQIGARFELLDNKNKDAAATIRFLDKSGYERNLENVINYVIEEIFQKKK